MTDGRVVLASVSRPSLLALIGRGGLLLLPLLLSLWACAQAPASRGTAEVGIIADLTSSSPTDEVSIRILHRTDKARLSAIAATLGEKFQTAPAGSTFGKVDPEVEAADGLGLTCRLPVVPRVTKQKQYLPIAPFIEAFAPYVSHMRILYIIKGPFTYQGVEQYKHKDVEFTVEIPPFPPALQKDSAYYCVNVDIKNPTLTAAAVPTYPDEAPPARKGRHVPPLVWVPLAGLLGAGIGTVLAKLLARWKAAAAQALDSAPSGGQHD